MTDYDALVAQLERKLLKALDRLEYTYKKIETLPSIFGQLDEEQLETWESFAARFGRAADLFMTRYLRAVVLKEDPGYEGTLRDFLNLAEKFSLIDRSRDWLEIRELRNLAVHEYMEENLTKHFSLMKEKTPLILALRARIEGRHET